MDILWVQIKSWHAARPKDHADTSYCGQNLIRAIPLPISDELPAGKSCESCLRIVARIKDDHAKAVD